MDGQRPHRSYERIVRLIEENRLEVIRLSYPDQHGILRGKTIMAGEAEQAMRNGCAITTTLLAKDTSHTTVFRFSALGAVSAYRR